MTLRPWLKSVRKVLGTSSRGHSRRRQQALPCAAQMETLESKQLLAAAMSAGINYDKNTHVVTITGEDSQGKGDVATVTESGNQIIVKLTRSSGLSESKTYNASSVTRIDFFGLKGDDKFDNKVNIDSKAEGGAGNDTLYGGIGNDTIDGGGDDDKIDGRNRKDTLKGGDGNDVIEGGDDLAADELHGGSGSDTLKGQGGADSLYGNGDDDTLKGGDGDDLLQGGGGVDECDGGSGDGDKLLAELSSGADYDLILTNTRLNNNVLIGIEKAELVGNSKGNLLDASGFTEGSVTLIGGDGNDTLYGGSASDLLQGGNGNDGLYGGEGRDVLEGGKGADRFLIEDVEGFVFVPVADPIRDAKPEDAVITFLDKTTNWTAYEIRAIDQGLAWLHNKTNNTTLLKLKNGDDLTFERHQDLDGANANNTSDGTIRFANAGINAVKGADAVAVHEIGHNWDSENARWSDFMGKSKWQSHPLDRSVPKGFVRARNLDGEAQPYIYSKDAGFARADGYGKTNPHEDFASTIECYYRLTRDATDSGVNAKSTWQSKWDFVDSFLKTQKS